LPQAGAMMDKATGDVLRTAQGGYMELNYTAVNVANPQWEHLAAIVSWTDTKSVQPLLIQSCKQCIQASSSASLLSTSDPEIVEAHRIMIWDCATRQQWMYTSDYIIIHEVFCFKVLITDAVKFAWNKVAL
jgi:hypothetical protein